MTMKNTRISFLDKIMHLFLYIFLMRTAVDMQRIGVIFLKRLNSSLEKC